MFEIFVGLVFCYVGGLFIAESPLAGMLLIASGLVTIILGGDEDRPRYIG